MNHLPHNVTPRRAEQAASDYSARAELHRPSDPAALAAAVLELSRQGLQPADIGYALRVSTLVVLSMLQRDRGGSSAVPLDESGRFAPVQSVREAVTPPPLPKCARTGIPVPFCTCIGPHEVAP